MKARPSAIVFAFVAVLLIGGCASGTGVAGPIAFPADGVLLKMNSSKGDKETLKTVTDMDMDVTGIPGAEKAPNGGKMKMTMTMTVENECTAAEGGKFTWKSKMTDVKVEGNVPGADAQVAALKGQEYTTIYDESGKVLKVEGPAQAANAGANAGLELPKHKVKIGDTWESTTENQGVKVTMVYKVEGMERVNGEDCVLTSATAKEGAMLKTPTPIKTWLSSKTGRAVKSEGTMEASMMGKMKMRVSMEKLS
jgi:hypothetical protein